MKRVLLLTMLLGIFFSIKSQDAIISFFDSNWQLTEKSNAEYYRNAFKDQYKKWVVKDFYINGRIQMIGSYTSKSLKKRNGYFEFYYENGKVKMAGNYNRNKRNGEWKWYRKDGSISSVETYNKDKLLNYTFYNEDGSKVKGKPKIIEYAEFPGGQDALLSFLSKEIKYPESVQSQGISGKVYIQFIINEEGFVKNAKVPKSVHADLDKEALRVVNSMPRWKPGKKHNQFADISYTVPINFILQ